MNKRTLRVLGPGDASAPEQTVEVLVMDEAQVEARLGPGWANGRWKAKRPNSYWRGMSKAKHDRATMDPNTCEECWEGAVGDLTPRRCGHRWVSFVGRVRARLYWPYPRPLPGQLTAAALPTVHRAVRVDEGSTSQERAAPIAKTDIERLARVFRLLDAWDRACREASG